MAGTKHPLSNRELDIMNTFWDSDKPLIASEIVQINSELSINTVQATLKKLLNKSYIKISDIVYSGTVLTRSYEALVTRDTYMVNQIRANQVSTLGLVSQLIQEEEDPEVLEKLAKLIREKQDALRSPND
ncbi:MAG: BlaI/MecI/CopY family transcriptional regulator [Eubacteriales bacterium]|nr:BlaI/MecI/CopY family transcriptional regulator [Eubacteriales bacterium]